MTRKSLRACKEGIEKAREAIIGKQLTHEKLAEHAGFSTRQPVTNFFGGKGVDPKNFVRICEILGLDWREITGEPFSVEHNNETLSINELRRAEERSKVEKKQAKVQNDLLIQDVEECNGHLPTNITISISLESTNSIRSTLQMQNEQAVSGLMPFDSNKLKKIISEFPQLAYRYPEDNLKLYIIDYGKQIYNLTLVQPIKQVVERLESSVVELIIEPDLQCIPWELMHDENNFLCFKHYIGRCITSEVSYRNLKKIAKRRLFSSNKKLRLLIVSTIGDLEASLICELAYKKNAHITKIIQGTQHEVLDHIYSGQDIIHLTGHIANDGFFLSDGILDINILNEAISQHGTSLVVLSACETGFSSKVNNKSTGYQLALNELNVICSLTWITSDLGKIITSTFYENVLAGKSFGESLQLAKKKAYPMSGWWGYILYGNPLESLKSIEEVRNRI